MPIEDIDEWISSGALRAVTEAFGGGPELFTGALADRLAQLDTFSERWDTRRGKERNLAAHLELTAEQDALVHAAAAALGLIGSRPPRETKFDHLVMLGGLVRACVTRPVFAARLLESGTLQVGQVTALGGHRPFGGDEFDLARLAGIPEAAGEFDALDAGTRAAFRLGAPVSTQGEISDLPGGSWSLKTYKSHDGLTVHVAAAPSSDPAHRRANTADSYDWFARHVAQLEPGQTILAVTTAIYVPAQQAAAIRMLARPYGVSVETVGMTPGDVVPALDQTFTATHYLQEIRSSIRSLRLLAESFGD